MAQAPAIQWQKCLGGSAKDSATCIRQTSDGGYIVAGYTYSNDGNVSGNHGGADVWVVKLTSAGAISWQKTYGGSAIDEANATEQTSDGGYIIVGRTSSADGEVSLNKGMTDAWIVKLDSNGNMIWEKTYGGSGPDEATAVKQTKDGGYIVAAWTASLDGDPVDIHNSVDYWILKLTDSGTIGWNKCYGGYADEMPYAIQQTKDSGYVVAGWSMSYDGDVSGNKGGVDYWVVKLDDTGKISWNKSLGGLDDDLASAVVQSADGGYVICGYTWSSDGDVKDHRGSGANTDMWLVKLDSIGNIDWSKCYGGSDGDNGTSVERTSDGGYIVAGGTVSRDGDVTGVHTDKYGFTQDDFWVVKIDDTGAINWAKCYGGTGEEIAKSVLQTSDGGYMVAGYSNSNDSEVSGNHGLLDFWVIKLNASTGIPASNQNMELRVYPNPINTELIIDGLDKGAGIKIFDIVGQLVFTGTAGADKIIVNTAGFAKGTYILELVNERGECYIQKIIKY